MATIGFVGLGHMGLPMAFNLVKAGHRVTGFDLQESALDQFKQGGGLVAASLSHVAIDQEIIITMLQKAAQVKQVCIGEEGLFQKARKGALFIDCSTIDVDSSKSLHQLAGDYQLKALDAPVSGGVAGAGAGTLTFMVGGQEEAFELAKPILACMGKKMIHAGAAGAGQAAKICNNMILGISMIAVSEAFSLGRQLGLSSQKLFEVVNSSSGQCWSMSHYVPVPGILDKVPANNDYQPGFAAAMMLKDLLLSQEAAKAAQLETPLGEKACLLYQQLIDKGLGDVDFSAIIKLISKEV